MRPASARPVRIQSSRRAGEGEGGRGRGGGGGVPMCTPYMNVKFNHSYMRQPKIMVEDACEFRLDDILGFQDIYVFLIFPCCI